MWDVVDNSWFLCGLGLVMGCGPEDEWGGKGQGGSYDGCEPGKTVFESGGHGGD